MLDGHGSAAGAIAGDDGFHDLGRAVADLESEHVAQPLLHRAVVVASVAEHQQALVDGVVGELRPPPFALIGLQVLAVARVALEETWDYVAQREAFGKPLAAFQGVSHPLADFDTQVEAARLLCLQTLWLKDRGAPHSAEAAMCKWWAPKLAYDAIHQCLLMFGHGGYDHGPMEQRLRDVLGFQIGDGTAQIMKTIIARTRAGRAAVPV